MLRRRRNSRQVLQEKSWCCRCGDPQLRRPRYWRAELTARITITATRASRDALIGHNPPSDQID